MNIYYPKSKPVGALQIIHGMGEHSLRYLDFTNFLVENGFIVILSDHLGHGKKALEKNKLGIINESFQILVDNQIKISENFLKNHPEINLFILGHSMGSFIAQGHMKALGNTIKGYILMGGCGKRKLLPFLGKVFFKLLSFFTNKPLGISNRIFFSECESRNTPFNWLTTDQKELQKYLDDPLCGFSYNPYFYFSFLDFITKLYNAKDFKNINKNLKILIVSGEKDPVGIFGKGVKSLYKFYLQNNFKNINFKLFFGMKHEILNEKNKEKVYNFLINWLKK